MANTQMLINKILAGSDPARGINSVTKNSVTKNSETQNSATDPAHEAQVDLGDLTATSSSLGRASPSAAPVVEASEISARGNYNPAEIWGIQAQQVARKSLRPTYHLTIQFAHQVPDRQALLVTVYTYPHDRLREYKPQNTDETQLYEWARDNAHASIGRLMTRGKKGQVIDDMLAYSIFNESLGCNRLIILFDHTEYAIDITCDPTPAQAVNYLKTGHWGNQLQLISNQKRISIFDCPTRTGECQ